MALLAAIARDIAELVRAGYPEETARRIATGELPMDTASRMERARQQGFNPDDVEYHGTENYFTEFEPSLRGKMGPGVYTTPDPSLAEIHAASGQIMPLLLRGDYISRADAFDMRPDVTGRDGQRILNETLQQAGYAGTKAGSRGSLSPETVTFDPSNIRSYYSAAFDPEYTGPNILGGAALPVVGGLLAAGQSEDADAGFVTRGGKTLLEAWHGSPHKFDKFSMDQIGTGEGAQAYGHGLYFADSEDVARGYKRKLEKGGGLSDDDTIARVLNSVDGDTEKAVAELRRRGNTSLQGETPENAKRFFQMAQKVSGGYDPRGALYRAEIDVTPESLLDWDKPLSADTPQQMKDAINTLVKNNPDLKDDLYQAYRENQPGSIYYSLLSDYAKTGDIVKNQQFATQQLNDAGIKGIKYLDGDSRTAGNGTSNYVIFDDSLINIAERGAADPQLLGGTALGTAGILGAIAAGDRNDTAIAASPRSDTLQDITMGLRGVERRLKGSPASLLFPEGVVNYLETVNRPYEDPTALTRAIALLDLL